MGQQLIKRIVRSYRKVPPGKFHNLNQRISKALTGNDKIPESTWGANPDLLPTYLAASQKHDAVHQEALYGSRLVIAERDLLQAQITNYLDEIALVLEAKAISTPDILLVSGFDLAKERRSNARTKPPIAASEASTTEPQDPA